MKTKKETKELRLQQKLKDKQAMDLYLELTGQQKSKHSNQIAIGGVMMLAAGIGFILLIVMLLQGKSQWVLIGMTLGSVALAVAGRIISKHFEDKRNE